MPEAISNGMALFFAWLFAIAALHKLQTPDYYLRLMSSYMNVSYGGPLLVRLVALSELCLAFALLLPGLNSVGFVGAASLLASYAAMMAWQYAQGRSDLQCGCAGPASSLTVGPALIVRNLVCAALALLAMASASSGLPGSIAGASLALVVAVFMIFVYLCSDQIIANAQAMAGEI